MVKHEDREEGGVQDEGAQAFFDEPTPAQVIFISLYGLCRIMETHRESNPGVVFVSVFSPKWMQRNRRE